METENTLLPKKLEQIQILKVKRDKETHKLEVSVNIIYHNDKTEENEEKKDVFAEMIITPDYPIHEDLQLVFQELGIHLAFVTDQLRTEEYTEHFFTELLADPLIADKTTHFILKRILATYVIFGKDEEKSVVALGGQRLLQSGNILNMNATNVWYERTENYNYRYWARLDICLENLRKEVISYLYGKHSPIAVQLEMFPPKKKKGNKMAEVEEAIEGQD